MKRIPWTVVTLICLLLIVMGLLTTLSTRFPMPWQCSKLYWQYWGQEGIKASYVRDYPVDDTTLVDVTLLHATTDSAWVKLCQETFSYNYPDSIKEEILHGRLCAVVTRVEEQLGPQFTNTDIFWIDKEVGYIAKQVSFGTMAGTKTAEISNYEVTYFTDQPTEKDIYRK